MPQHHDNTKPAAGGRFTIGKIGALYIFPIEKAGYMKPASTLVLHMKPNGELYATLDIRYTPEFTDDPND